MAPPENNTEKTERQLEVQSKEKEILERLTAQVKAKDSHAEITLASLFPEKVAKGQPIRPILRQGGRYYVVLDTLGKGDFGKAKYALDLDSKELYVLKTQETFEKRIIIFSCAHFCK